MEHLLLAVILRLIRKDARLDPMSGEMVLDYGWIMRGLGLLGTGFPVALALALFVVEGPGNRDSNRIIVGLLAFGFLTAFLIVETFGVSIRISDQSIVAHSAWRLPRTIAWDDVVRVNYSHVMAWFVVVGSDGTKIRASLFLSGIGTLVSEINSRLAPPVFEKARAGFAAIGY